MVFTFSDVVSLLPTILVAVICLLVTKNYVGLLARRKGLPPGPVSLPIIGSLYAFPRDLSKLPFAFAKLSKKYGGIFSIQAPNGISTIVLTDVDLIKQTFVKGTDSAGRPFPRAWSQQIFNPFFPDAGVVFSDYDEQLKLQRNTSMVVFRSLGYGKKSIENKIIEEADHLGVAFEKFKGSSFNAKPLVENAVANIICALLFGERYTYGDKELIQLQHCVDKIFEFVATSSLIDSIPIVRRLPNQKRKINEFSKVCKLFNEFSTRKIEETKKRMGDGEERFDFISVYLDEIAKSDGKVLDRSHQLVKDFFGAGAETTATTLGWVLYFMIKYPDVQKKVRDEINSVVGKGNKPTLKDREKLPYTEATLAEVLRVCPTAPTSLPHSTITTTEIQGYKIPRKSVVIAVTLPNVWDEVVFPEPYVLRPERHLDAQGQFVKHEILMPFGVGRRSCLGEQLAKQELFLFFSHLVQRFEFKVPEGETLPPQKGQWFLTYRPPLYDITATPAN